MSPHLWFLFAHLAVEGSLSFNCLLLDEVPTWKETGLPGGLLVCLEHSGTSKRFLIIVVVVVVVALQPDPSVMVSKFGKTQRRTEDLKCMMKT